MGWMNFVALRRLGCWMVAEMEWCEWSPIGVTGYFLACAACGALVCRMLQ